MMWLDDALLLLLDRVVELTLEVLGKDASIRVSLCEKVKSQLRIPLALASTKYREGLTVDEIETWAINGSMHLVSSRRVGYQSNEEQLARAFRNYLMSAYLEYSGGLKDLP